MSLQIRVQDLSFRYGASTVLDGVNLSLEEGDFIGIIGPNGSGKSTLLKNLAAILKPEKGRVLLNGKDVQSWPRRELAKVIAMAGQERAAGFNFAVTDVVAMGRYPYLNRFGKLQASDHRAIERAMHLTGCYQLRQREIFALSGGERQRVALARALAQEAPCILLDEPTTFLDIGYQVELLELLLGLNRKERLTLVLVVHDLNIASRYCRQIFLLHQGRLFISGTPEEVLTRENLLEVYRTEVFIEPHPLKGTPQVIPVSSRASPDRVFCRQRIHVIGGGGSATPLLKQLYLNGFSISAGVLSVGDGDWVTARRLGLDLAEETPFAPISEARYRENLALINTAQLVLLAPLCIGAGNLLNLQAALHARARGIPVLMINQPPVETRDFVGGEGAALCKRIEMAGAINVPVFNLELLADHLLRRP